MTIVVVDSNVLAESPLLQRRAWMSLVEHADAWGICLVVPEVVVMETVNVVVRRWQDERDALAELKLGVFAVGEQLTAIEAKASGYETWLLHYLDQHGITVEQVPQIDHMDIARRASAGRNPFRRSNGKTKDGYRDTLIWLTLLSVARSNGDEEVWLVSNNTRDFGVKDDSRKSTDARSREEQPDHLFDEHFAEELVEHGLSDRVRYITSIERLEQHFASQFAPIAASNLSLRVAAIKKSLLGSKLMYAALGLDLDPEAVALPVPAVAAQIVGVREQQEGWSFTEAAGRGDAGWTARFSVATEVDLDMVSAPLIGNELTKVLRLTGQVLIAPDGDVVDLTVDAAAALPDDPMRARWTRRAGRGPSTPSENAAQLGLIGNLSSQMRDLNQQIGQVPGIADVVRNQMRDLNQQIGQVPGIAD